MQTRFGCGAISNSKGKTLFYSDGLNIYDSSHNAIPNCLFNSKVFSSQPALFVPWPDSSHLYFLFTPYVNNDSCLKYSIVNCKLRNGLGGIEKGNLNIKLPSYALGKINAIRHANRHDYWLMVPQINTDSVYTYLITNKGVQLPPIRSKIGVVFKYYSPSSDQSLGYLKFSPDGKKVGHVSIKDSSFIADFDASTGKVSNPWWFYSRGALSFEYSNTSRYLYMCQYGNKVVQFDLESSTINDFMNSKKTIDSGSAESYVYGVMQLASDGKIYIFPDPRFTNSPPNYAFLNVIHSPDSIGKKARVERNFISLGYFSTTGSVGLPDMVQSFFNKPSFRVKQNCSNDTVFFTIKDTYQLDSVHWDFGDTISGTLNISTKTNNVFHHYKKLGTYKVRLISFHKSYTDTIYETFLLKPLKPNIGKDTNFCKSKVLSLSPNEEYAGYKWSTSQTIKSIYVTNPGTYILTVSDYSGCKGSDTIKILKPIVKADFTINDASQCFKGNDFKLKENTNYTGGLRQNDNWFLNDSLLSNDSLFNISFKDIGSYPIKLVSESYGGCRDSITKTLNVYPNIKVSFTLNDSIQCLNTNRFDFTNTTPDTGSISYQWDLGDQTNSSQKNILGKTYSKDSFYKIRLISTTINNCKDTIAKKIVVLPNPKADYSWDLACSRTATNFLYTGTKSIKTFQWNFNNETTSSIENPSHKFASAGTSTTTLIITSDNGCTDTLKKTIEIKPQANANFTTTDGCETDSASFKNLSQDATSYLWKFGDGQKSTKANPKHKYQLASTTTYNVTLVAQVTNGCADSVSKAVTINQNPSSDFSYTYNGNKVDLKIAKGGNSYQWKFGTTDSLKTTTTTYTHTIKSSDQHTVCLIATDVSGCSSKTCKNITVGILNLSEKSFKIFPNPNNGTFTIEIENPEKDVSIEVYNVMGELVEKIGRVGKVNLLDLEVISGIYLVKVKNGDSVRNQKVIVGLNDTN